MKARDIISKVKNTGITQGDLVLVSLLLVLSAVLMCIGIAGKQAGTAVRVSVDGQQVAVLSLERDVRYEIPGGSGNILEITGGRVHMLAAECPDGSCMAQGFVSRSGECIVCLPARITVTVVASGGESELDAVAY